MPDRDMLTPASVLAPRSYRMAAPFQHVEVSRMFMAGVDKPWYICRGPGRGDRNDYWREGEGWVFNTPSRYATAESGGAGVSRCDGRGEARKGEGAMTITVCDVCRKQPAASLQVPVGRSLDGVETSTDYARVDLCLEHAIMVARCALTEYVPEEKREEAIKKPREQWQGGPNA